MKFEIIKCDPAPPTNYHAIYHRNFKNAIEQAIQDENNRTALRRLVYYGVKAFNSNPLLNEYPKKFVIEDYQTYFNYGNSIKVFIAQLTPNELINIFPIIKTYDGERRGVKDYFFTMDALKQIGFDTVIGNKNIDELLWDYQNDELHKFECRMFRLMNRLYKVETGTGIIEQWTQTNNIPAHTMTTDERTGKKYLTDNTTGKITKVKMQMPNGFKIIRSGGDAIE